MVHCTTIDNKNRISVQCTHRCSLKLKNEQVCDLEMGKYQNKKARGESDGREKGAAAWFCNKPYRSDALKLHSCTPGIKIKTQGPRAACIGVWPHS